MEWRGCWQDAAVQKRSDSQEVNITKLGQRRANSCFTCCGTAESVSLGQLLGLGSRHKIPSGPVEYCSHPSLLMCTYSSVEGQCLKLLNGDYYPHTRHNFWGSHDVGLQTREFSMQVLVLYDWSQFSLLLRLLSSLFLPAHHSYCHLQLPLGLFDIFFLIIWQLFVNSSEYTQTFLNSSLSSFH